MHKKIIQYIILTLIIISFAHAQDLSDYRIYVNPGHGGNDSDDRYISATGFWESEGNLTKGLYLRKLLENMGATVGISRTTNFTSDDLPLSTISNLANNFQADIFESIHSNGYNGELNYTLMLYRGWDPGVSGTNYGTYVTGALYPLSEDLSFIMANEIYVAHNTTAKHVRGDWSFYSWTDSNGNRSGLGVLRGLTMPGTLSEGSFHDYIPESWRLQNMDYRRNESWAIARSFAQLYGQPDFPFKNFSGIVRDPLETVPYFSISSKGDHLKPVNNITATLKQGEETWIYYGDTMNNGFFHFDSLYPGTYTLIIEAEHYYPDTQEVVIGDAFFNRKVINLISSKPPTLLSSIPVQNEPSHPAWEPIVLRFSHEMDTSSVKEAISINPAEDLVFSWNSDHKILTLTPVGDSLAFETAYTLTIEGNAINTQGLPFDGNNDGVGGDNFILNFTTTKADIDPPRHLYTLLYPPNIATNVETDPIINLIFDERISDSSVDADHFKLEKYSTGTYEPVDIYHDIINKQSVITLVPQTELEPNTVYRTTILQGGISDLFGNTMEDRTRAYRFTTGPDYAINQTIDDFTTGFSKWQSPTYSGSTTGIISASIEQSVEKVLPLNDSENSMKLTYYFDETASAHLIREYQNPQTLQFDNSYLLQVYIYGTGNNISFRFCVDDNVTPSGTGHEVSPWYKIDWYGWRLVSWDLANDEPGEWIGDGSVDGALRMDSFQFTWHDDANPQGEIYIDNLKLVKKSTTSIQPTDITIPQSLVLHGNYPNPFNPETAIAFSLPEGGNINIRIFNLNGTLIRNLIHGFLSEGYHEIVWNGKDNSGKIVSSGEYIYRVETSTSVSAGKMLFMK